MMDSATSPVPKDVNENQGNNNNVRPDSPKINDTTTIRLLREKLVLEKGRCDGLMEKVRHIQKEEQPSGPCHEVTLQEDTDSKKIVSSIVHASFCAAREPSTIQVVNRMEKNKKTFVRNPLYSVPKGRKRVKACQEREVSANRDYSGQHATAVERSENDKEEQSAPGAYDISGPQADSYLIDEHDDPAIVDGSMPNDMLDGDTNDRAMLVEADLAPELTLAEEVNIQEEEAVIAKKMQYKRALRFAMPCYGLAIIFNISGFVFMFLLDLDPDYWELDTPIWFGFIESACLFFIATWIIFRESTTRCCASKVALEQYAPDDTELLQETYIASIVTLCLFTFVAIPILVKQNFLWLGYTCMVWYFAGTVFTFSRVHLLQRSKETRQKKPKLFWIIFLAFFLGLSGATIWYLWKPIYPDCDVPYPYYIGDGVCDGEPYASEVCGYDGGDCSMCPYDDSDCGNVSSEYPDCIVPNPSWIGNGFCDGRLYGTVECGFDGGDCLGPGERCHEHGECASEVCNFVTKVCDSGLFVELYPNCTVVMPDWIGDGECDGGYYASEACGFDGGDCMKLDEPCLQDDECASGFCNAETRLCYLGILEQHPDCVVEYPMKIGDGKCDIGAYATEACGYDGGDCSHNSSVSPTAFSTFHIAVVALLSLQLLFA